MRAGVVRAVAFGLSFFLLAAAPGHAQAPPAPPPLPGFVLPYEITRIVRTAGFDPLAPPLREGTTYVVRATDFRGILMRVVVDARSGAIRAVNRIVAGPGPYGAVGMLPPPYGRLPPYSAPPAYAEPPAYGPPSAYGPEDVGAPEMAPEEGSVPGTGPPPPAMRPVSHAGLSGPPLPRPRPPELASRKAGDEKASIKPATAPAPPSSAGSAAGQKRPAIDPLPD